MTKSYAPGAPSWIDLGSTNIDAAAEFYTALFGWTVEDFGTSEGDYRIFSMNGRQVAGLGPATDPARGTSWTTYFATPNAQETAAKVTAHGGKVIVEPMDVMDEGTMGVFVDPNGAFFSVWQPKAHKGMEHTGEHGGFVWAELSSTNLTAAKDFYAEVLAATTRDINDEVQSQVGMAYILLEADGQAVAGMMASRDEANYWGVYFAVDNLDAAADQAIALGAKELSRQDAPPGRMATLIDPQPAAIRFSSLFECFREVRTAAYCCDHAGNFHNAHRNS